VIAAEALSRGQAGTFATACQNDQLHGQAIAFPLAIVWRRAANDEPPWSGDASPSWVGWRRQENAYHEGVVIYSGRAILDDGERQETIGVTLQSSDQQVTVHPFDAESAKPVMRATKKWGGRITSKCDMWRWRGKPVTLSFPTGHSGYVVVEASGVITGIDNAPFDS
jgi:hypothetical protein